MAEGNRKLLNIELGRISVEEYRQQPDTGIVVVLDNIRSAHNVGSVFRSCDSFKADKIMLCGISPVPPSAEIHKSALGAENSVPWQHFDSTIDAVRSLKDEGYEIISIEQALGSISLDRYNPFTGSTAQSRIAIIFGNEVSGVSQEVVDFSDKVLEIPQYGTKHSLNVSVTAGIILWHLRLMMNQGR